MTTQNDRQRQAEDAAKKAAVEFGISEIDAFKFMNDFKAGVQWADSTPQPQEVDEEAWERVRENFLPSYQTSNGKLIFMYGIAHARRAQAAEIERLKELLSAESAALGVANAGWQFQEHQNAELRALLNRAKYLLEQIPDEIPYSIPKWLEDYAALTHQEPENKEGG